MTDEPNNSSSGRGIVRIELTPAARENPPNPIDLIKALVEQFFAECVTRRDDFAFQPFLETARTTREIKRLQTVAEQRAAGRMFAEWGCISCHSKNAVHAGCGLCTSCYALWKGRKKKAIRENSNEPEIEFKLKAADQEKLARLALVGTSIAGVGDVPSFLQAATSEAADRAADMPAKHEGRCVICSHPRRQEIEEDFIHSGHRYGGVRAIVRKYGLKGTASLYKHARAVGLNAKREQS